MPRDADTATGSAASFPAATRTARGTGSPRRVRSVLLGGLAVVVAAVLVLTWIQWGPRTAEMGSPARAAAGIPISPRDHPWYFPVLVGHIACASIALAAGLVQLSSGIRRRYLSLHRYSGRVYVLAGVYPALLLAVVLEVFWPFSAVTSVSQWALCALWGITTTAGLVQRRRGRIPEHRRWMYRSYALTASSLVVVFVEPFIDMIIRPDLDTRLAGSTDIFIQATDSTGNWLSIVIVVVAVEWFLEWERSGRSRGGSHGVLTPSGERGSAPAS